MGLIDVLAGFLSSEGSQDRGGRDPGSGSNSSTNSADAQGSEDDDPDQQTEFDVELEELDNEEQVEALEGRIEELEGTIDTQSSELETIKGSQQEVAEQLNEVNDTVRQLLGIYDQLTADMNPFMDGPTRAADPDADGFGVVSEADADPDDDVVGTIVDDTTSGASEESPSDSEPTVIGLEDIKAAHEAATDEGSPQGTEAHVVQQDEPADNEIEVEPTTGGAGMNHGDVQEDRRGTGSWREADERAQRADSTVTLSALADTYATEIIVFEWLTGLVATAGPAATLRAIAYYEEIGWIDREVKQYLEDVLSGPDLDMNVDPSRDPNELTAEDHAESYEYIMKLDAVQRTIEDTGLT